MDFLSGFWGYIAAAAAAIVGVVGIWLKGRNTGKKVAEGERTKDKLAQQEKRNETLKTAKDVGDSVNKLPDSDVRNRLQDKYGRN